MHPLLEPVRTLGHSLRDFELQVSTFQEQEFGFGEDWSREAVRLELLLQSLSFSVVGVKHFLSQVEAIIRPKQEKVVTAALEGYGPYVQQSFPSSGVESPENETIEELFAVSSHADLLEVKIEEEEEDYVFRVNEEDLDDLDEAQKRSICGNDFSEEGSIPMEPEPRPTSQGYGQELREFSTKKKFPNRSKSKDGRIRKTKRASKNKARRNFDESSSSSGSDSDSDSDWTPQKIMREEEEADGSFTNQKHSQPSALATATEWPKVRKNSSGYYSCLFCSFQGGECCKVREHMGIKHEQRLLKKFGFKLSEVWRHKCARCGKLFSCDSSLQKHALKYTEERPFRCNRCGASFKSNSSLTRHKENYCHTRPFTLK